MVMLRILKKKISPNIHLVDYKKTERTCGGGRPEWLVTLAELKIEVAKRQSVRRNKRMHQRDLDLGDTRALPTCKISMSTIFNAIVN